MFRAMQKVEEKELNGLTVSKLEAFVNEIRTKPEAAQAVNGPWQTRVEWQGGLRAKANIYVKADADKATLERLWNEAWKRSVVAQTVTRGARIVPEFEIV